MEPPRRPRPKGDSPTEDETADGTPIKKPEPVRSRPITRRDLERRLEPDPGAHPEIMRALERPPASNEPKDPNAETQPLPPSTPRRSPSDTGRIERRQSAETGRLERRSPTSDTGKINASDVSAPRPKYSARGLSQEGQELDLKREIGKRVQVHHRTGTGPTDTVRLRRLLEINKALNREQLELGRLLDMIMDAAISLSGAARGFLVTWDRGEARIARARNLDKETIDSPEAAISRHLVREALDRRETVVTAEAAVERIGYASAQGLDLKSVMVSPLLSRGRVVGAIYLDDPDRVGAFQPEDVTTLEAFCDQAAIALANAYKLEEANNRFESQRFKLKRIEAEVRKADQESVRRFGNIVGKSAAMRKVFDLLERVIDTSFPIVITGESGVGKELVAKAIHFHGPRKDGPFVATSCAAVPETLLDSELFGYASGAFTGASHDRKGLFEQAHSGTLFLDEIEEMSPGMQGKLLRVLQEGEIRRVGAKETISVNVRCLCATNRDLRTMVERGEFRRDLYYRLNVIPVVIPPLRERKEDIPYIVGDILSRLDSGVEKEKGAGPLEVTKDSLEALTRFNWPGNVRELENELKRVVALGVRRIGLGDLASRIVAPQAPGAAPLPGALPARAEGSASSDLPTLNLRQVERLAIEKALNDAGGNKTQAAKVLGLSRRGLLKKLERFKDEHADTSSEDEALGSSDETDAED